MAAMRKSSSTRAGPAKNAEKPRPEYAQGRRRDTENSIGAKEGDTVVITLDGQVQATAYCVFFLLPIIALFLSESLGHYVSVVTGVQGLDAASGLAGLAVSVIYSIRKIRKLDKSTKFQITKIIDTPSHQEGC